MDAELIAIGSELLRPGFRDTNSGWLSDRLARLGIRVRQVTLVGDDAGRIAERVREGAGRAAVVLLTGGLGPTADDRTREAVARALGVALENDAPSAATIAAFLRARGREPSAEQLAQALRPTGARTLPNPVGTAPGFLAERDGTIVAALPGVPAEMRAMFDESLVPWIRRRSRRAVRRMILKVGGRTESSVDAQVRDLYGGEGVEATILAKSSGIELVLEVEGSSEEEAAARLAALERAFSLRLGDDLFGRDDETLPVVVGRALAARGQSVATAESCTGGLLGAALTSVPGSSAWYRGGWVTYADDLKRSLAGVDGGLLAEHGAVSGVVAEALAAGAVERCRSDWGIGITGIAGPGGGSAVKPVGLVFLGLAGPGERRHVSHRLGGDRELVRARATSLALDFLRRAIGPGA